jgi:hypothetical protein
MKRFHTAIENGVIITTKKYATQITKLEFYGQVGKKEQKFADLFFFCSNRFNFSWFILKAHVSSSNLSRACVNHTLCVAITLVHVEITVVSFVITFVRFNITLRVEITLCVLKLHSACVKYILRVEVALYINKSHSCVS